MTCFRVEKSATEILEEFHKKKPRKKCKNLKAIAPNYLLFLFNQQKNKVSQYNHVMFCNAQSTIILQEHCRFEYPTGQDTSRYVIAFRIPLL